MEVLEALFVIHILYQITCLSPCLIDRQTWTLKESKLLEIYTLSVIAVSLSLMLFSLLAKEDFTQIAKDGLEQTVHVILMLGARLAHVISICEALFRKKEQKSFYEQLKEVDCIFVRSLHIDVKNQEFLRTSLVFGFLMLFAYLAAELLFLTSSAGLCEGHFLLFWCFHIMPLLVYGLRYFQIFTAIRMLKHRLELLVNIFTQINLETQVKENRDLMPKADTKESLNCKYSWALFEASLCKDRKSCEMESPELKRLLIVRDLYNRLYHLSETLNVSFGFSMLTNLSNDFIAIISNCYWIFYNFHDGMLNSNVLSRGSYIWLLAHVNATVVALLNVIVLALLGESIVQIANKIPLNLHRINIDIRNDNHNTVIEQFSLQLLHQKMLISAAGFFTIDCALLYTMAGTTTTYLIILIQFHMNSHKH